MYTILQQCHTVYMIGMPTHLLLRKRDDPEHLSVPSARIAILSPSRSASSLQRYRQRSCYEFNSDITSKEEYDTTVHLVCNSQHKVKLNILSIPALYNPVLHFPQNTILFGQYSMLCEHYYKILEQVYIYIYICTDNWYNILIYVFSSSIGCKGISELW